MPLTPGEQQAAEAAFQGDVFNPAWGPTAHRIYHGIRQVTQGRNILKEGWKQHGDLLTQRLLALSGKSTLDEWRHLAGCPDLTIRHTVAEHPCVPATILHQLSHDHDFRVRMAVSRNRTTPAAILAHLAYDQFYMVRMGVASHPNTPIETLTRLNQDPHPEVQASLRLRHPPPPWRTPLR